MRLFFPSLLLLITIYAQAQDAYTNVYSEKAWADRDAWQKAETILQYLQAKPGAHVADIGCHEGYMTIKLSKRVGASGVVYAVDLEQTKLDKLKSHLEARKLTNVTVLKGEADDPHLPDSSLDAVLILDTYHEMKEHDKVLQRIKASLKSTGRLVICEPIAGERRKLSRADQERKHELEMSFALEDLAKAGFRILFKQDPFVDREKIKGDKMWIVVAVPEYKQAVGRRQ